MNYWLMMGSRAGKMSWIGGGRRMAWDGVERRRDVRYRVGMDMAGRRRDANVRIEIRMPSVVEMDGGAWINKSVAIPYREPGNDVIAAVVRAFKAPRQVAHKISLANITSEQNQPNTPQE